MGEDAPGIYGRHVGSGNVRITTQNADITTTSAGSPGIQGLTGYRSGTSAETDTPPPAAGDIYGCRYGVNHRDGRKKLRRRRYRNFGGDGLVDVRVSNSTITASDSPGIFALRHGTGTGDVNVGVINTRIETEGSNDYGVYGRANAGAPNIVIEVDRGHIITAGRGSHGVRGFRQDHDGNVDIDVIDTTITVTGDRARGIDAYVYQSDGDIDIFVEDSDITTRGEERAPRHQSPVSRRTGRRHRRHYSRRFHHDPRAASNVGNSDSGAANTTSGLEITHEGDRGDITIDVRDLEIMTEGTAVKTDQIGTLSPRYL